MQRPRPRLHLRSFPMLTGALAFCWLLVAVVRPAHATDFATHLFSFGEGPLWDVQELAVTPDGSLLICDNLQVRRYPLEGEGQYQHLLSVQPAPYFLRQSVSIACAPNGEIYVGDYIWGTITRLDAEGNVLNTGGGEGTGPGQFQGLTSLALAPDGTLYAGDLTGNRVQRFTADLQSIGAWPTPPPLGPPSYYAAPDALTVDTKGRVWVGWTDYYGGVREARILVYDSNGVPLRSFTVVPSAPVIAEAGPFFRDMDFDSAGRLRVLECGDEDAGRPLVTFNTDGDQTNVMTLPPGASRFTLLPDDSMVVGGRGGGVEVSFAEWFSSSGESLARWGEFYWASGRDLLVVPKRIGFDSEGRVLVSGGARVDPPSGTPYDDVYVYRYLADGSFDRPLHWGSTSYGMDYYFALTPEGELLTSSYPIAVDGQGCRYLLYTDYGVAREAAVLKYNSEGALLSSWGVPLNSVDLLVGHDGFLYVSRVTGIGARWFGTWYTVDRYSLGGEPLGAALYDAGELGAVDRGGRVYTFQENWDGVCEIQQYAPNGDLLGSITMAGREVLSSPSGLALSEDGKLAVVEKEAARVHIFQITPSRFSDIPWWYWAKEQIEGLAEAGIVSGYPDGTYHPTEVVTRGQLAVYLARALAGGEQEVPAGPGTASFYDVATSYWAYRHIEYCHAQGIVQGHFGRYYPEGMVDRGQMAIFLARALAGSDAAIPAPPLQPTFPDVTAFGPSAELRKYVEYLAAEGVVSGYPDGRYHPERVVTRDQMAVFVARAFELPM